jgi:hypothetical protein
MIPQKEEFRDWYESSWIAMEVVSRGPHIARMGKKSRFREIFVSYLLKCCMRL